jgi:hypothetical protein
LGVPNVCSEEKADGTESNLLKRNVIAAQRRIRSSLKVEQESLLLFRLQVRAGGIKQRESRMQLRRRHRKADVDRRPHNGREVESETGAAALRDLESVRRGGDHFREKHRQRYGDRAPGVGGYRKRCSIRAFNAECRIGHTHQ